MNSNNRFTQNITRLMVGVITTIAILAFALPSHVQAKSRSYQADLTSLINQVKNGDAGTLRGVFVPNVLADPIIQQPANNARFISEKPATVTEFGMATKAGNIGLIAHNTLAGSAFSKISQGDPITVVYGDGHTETFVVEKIAAFQVLPYGQYKDLQTGEILHIGEVFNLAYAGEYHLTLQTCIENEGNYSWGRLFIIATPVSAINNSADAQ